MIIVTLCILLCRVIVIITLFITENQHLVLARSLKDKFFIVINAELWVLWALSLMLLKLGN